MRVFVKARSRGVEGVGDFLDGARMRVRWLCGFSRRCRGSSGMEVDAALGEPGGEGEASFGRFGRFDEFAHVVGFVEFLRFAVQLVDLPGNRVALGLVWGSLACVSKLVGKVRDAVRLAWREAVEREDGFGGVFAGPEGVKRPAVRTVIPKFLCFGDVAYRAFRVRGEAA